MILFVTINRLQTKPSVAGGIHDFRFTLIWRDLSDDRDQQHSGQGLNDMGRAPCCDENGLKKGPWTPEEDQKLVDYIQKHGHGSWRALPKNAGLLRCGKSCRLRWTNYLRPDIKRGKFSFDEEQTILQLHAILGNKWSAIAAHLPGRTDNEIKNYWNTHLKKRLLQMGIDPMTHRPRTDLFAASQISQYFASLTQWENARMEAEARWLRDYLKLAAYRSSPNMLNGAENGNMNQLDINLLRSAAACRFDDPATALGSHLWGTQQQPVSVLALNSQNMDQHLVQGPNRCSGSYSVPDQSGNVEGLSLHQDQQGSVTQFLDNMCSLALGCAYSNPNLQLGQGAIAPPSDSCITDEAARKEISNVFNGENNLKLSENDKMKSYQDDYGHNLMSCTIEGPMINTKAEMSDHNTNFLWPDHKSNSLPALIPASGSPRSNPFSGPSDLGSNESSSSMVNNNNGNYGGSLVPPELLLDFTENSNTAKPIATVGLTSSSTQLWSDMNSEDGRDYWSNMLKLVDTIPAGLEHIIRPVQSE